MGSPIAERDVEDRFLPMTATEQALYETVETYISTAYDQAAAAERSAVGFVMTVYRRRVASSFHALRRTFERRLAGMDGRRRRCSNTPRKMPPEDELSDLAEPDELERSARDALVADERSQIARLLERTRALPPDSKLAGCGGGSASGGYSTGKDRRRHGCGAAQRGGEGRICRVRAHEGSPRAAPRIAGTRSTWTSPKGYPRAASTASHAASSQPRNTSAKPVNAAAGCSCAKRSSAK